MFLMPWHVVVTLSLANLLLLPLLLSFFVTAVIVDSSVDLAMWLGFILPLGGVSMTVLGSTVLSFLPIGFGRAPQLQENLSDPDIMTVMRETRGLLLSSVRYSQWRVRALFSDSGSPAVSLRQSRSKELEVVFRPSFLSAIEPGRAGMLCRSEQRLACIRAVVFHEMGHFLNGDYPIIRIGLIIARSYALAGIAAATSLSVGLAAAILGLWSTFHWLGVSVVAILVLAGLFCIHVWIWRRAKVDQESKADLRMLRSLTAKNRDVLFENRGGCPLWSMFIVRLACVDRARNLSSQNMRKKTGKAWCEAAKYWQRFRLLLVGTPRMFMERTEPLVKEVKAMQSSFRGPLSTPPSTISLQRVGFVAGAEASVLWFGAMLLATKMWRLWGFEIDSATQKALAWLYGCLFISTPSYLFMALCSQARTRLKTDSNLRFQKFLQLASAVILGCMAVPVLLLATLQLIGSLLGFETHSFYSSIRGVAILATVFVGCGCFMAWIVSDPGPGDATPRGIGCPAVSGMWPFIIAIFLIGPSIGAALWLGCGLLDSPSKGYVLGGLLFGFLPYIMTSLFPGKIRKAFPFGPAPSPGPVLGWRAFWRDWYMDMVRGTAVTQLVVTSALVGLGIATYSAISALFAILLGAVVDDLAATTAQLLIVVLIGAVAALVIPVMRQPRRIQVFSPANLHLMLRLATARKEGLALGETSTSMLKKCTDSLSLLLQYSNNVNVVHAVTAENGPAWLLAATLVVRLANELGCDNIVDELAPLLRDRLLAYVTPCGVVPAWPGGPPSLLWTAWAADLCMTLSIEMPARHSHPLDSLARLIEGELVKPSTRNQIRLGWWRRQMADGIDVLQRHCPTANIMPWATAIVDGMTIDGRACKGLWMSELLNLARLGRNIEIEEAIFLRNRTRTWELLQANADEQLGLLLDCWQVDVAAANEQKGGFSAAIEQTLASALVSFVNEDLQIQTDS